MYVELCLLLGISLKENQHQVNVSVYPCPDARNSVKESLQNPTIVPPGDRASTPDSWESNPNLKTLWVYRPAPLEPNISDDLGTHNVVLKSPRVLTKLAKPLTFGFDPYFHKGYYGPFEQRRRPVTLVAFRKQGIHLKKMLPDRTKSEEVAELQSPYNEISHLWQEGQA